jgi:hypothetical protein
MQLRSSDGQLIQLSDAAVRQSVTLQGAEDVDDGAPVPVPLLDSGRLKRVAALLEQTAAAFGLEGMADEARDALVKNGLPRGDVWERSCVPLQPRRLRASMGWPTLRRCCWISSGSMPHS